MFSALSVAGGTDTERSGSPSSVATMSTTTAEEWNEVCCRPAPPSLHSGNISAGKAPSEKLCSSSASSWSQVSEPPALEVSEPPALEVSEPRTQNASLEEPRTQSPSSEPVERRHCELMLRLEAMQAGIEALCRDVRRR